MAQLYFDRDARRFEANVIWDSAIMRMMRTPQGLQIQGAYRYELEFLGMTGRIFTGPIIDIPDTGRTTYTIQTRAELDLLDDMKLLFKQEPGRPLVIGIETPFPRRRPNR